MLHLRSTNGIKVLRELCDEYKKGKTEEQIAIAFAPNSEILPKKEYEYFCPKCKTYRFLKNKTFLTTVYLKLLYNL